jgi:hypothetical protein
MNRSRSAIQAPAESRPEPTPDTGHAFTHPNPSDEARAAVCEGLFAQLLFAARDLAQANLFEPIAGPSQVTRLMCRECRTLVDAMAHDPLCRTGRVLGVVGQLLANVSIADLAGTPAAACGIAQADGGGDLASTAQLDWADWRGRRASAPGFPVDRTDLCDARVDLTSRFKGGAR